MQKLIDISKWDGFVDFSKVAKAGYHVIMRCGYGQNIESQHDPRFMEYWRGCVENTIPFGVYIYSYASTKPGAQGEAAHALSQIAAAKSAYGGDLSYPVFIDLEESKYQSSADIVAKYFCEYIAENSAYDRGIYASYSWWNGVLASFKNGDVYRWVARWTEDESKRPSFADIWQYTSDGVCPGVDGRCDLNYSYININGSAETPSKSSTSSNGGSSIKTVQKWCKSKYGYSQAIDGINGRNTLKGLVKGLQTELNEQFGKALSVDGIFGMRTYNACVNIKPGAHGNLTKVIQGRLICLGYDTGGLDGIYGDCTENAIKDVQRKNGLDVDGICGKNTCRVLFS